MQLGKTKKLVLQATAMAVILVPIFYACASPQTQNRLIDATSPYLRQHADNPVDWFEWGAEALEKAKKENKPLLVSIGYASCHWCHVMEKESFMDMAVARIMNDRFVCIKVDREERPDIDQVYMNACQLITGGQGGWPLNAFALPDGKPFFAGTYYSRNSWIRLLERIADSYQNKNKQVLLQAEALTKGIVDHDLSLLDQENENTIRAKDQYTDSYKKISKQFDIKKGGLRGSPKFPMPAVWEYLLQYHYFTGDEKALEAVQSTLTGMALGGIYDQVGGGFARYSTDEDWHIPHFEKMLYDNAQLVSLYAHACQVTGNPLFKNIVQETIGFLERELLSPEGGWYSSLNADTKEGEGIFYAWTREEFTRPLEPPDAELLSDYFNISEKGNWEKKLNILYASQTPEEYGSAKNLPGFTGRLNKAKQKLLAERNKRTRPSTDDKILTSWNALMIKGLADAYAALGEDKWLELARKTASFIEQKMLDKDSSLYRSYSKGVAGIDAFLDDYALLADAFIRLYQVRFDIHWLGQAKMIADYALKNFYDDQSGMFYYTRHNASSPLVRKMEITDNVIPSSNSVMAAVLHALSIYYENDQYRAISDRMLSLVASRITEAPAFYANWAWLAGLNANGTYEVAIMGKDALAKNRQLQQYYLPSSYVMGETEKENLPLLRDKMYPGKTLVYVCTNRVCKKPVEDIGQAMDQLKKGLTVK